VGVGLWSSLRSARTSIQPISGERRTLTPDGSVVTLHARSRMRVKYTDRSVWWSWNRARRDHVAKDTRYGRFESRSQSKTVVALERIRRRVGFSAAVLVTLIEGHVAVTGVDPLSFPLTRQKGRNETLPLKQGEAGSRHRKVRKILPDPSAGHSGGTPDEALSRPG